MNSGGTPGPSSMMSRRTPSGVGCAWTVTVERVAAGVGQEGAGDAFQAGGWDPCCQVRSFDGDRQVGRYVEEFGESAQGGYDLGDARSGRGVFAGVGQEGVADRAHGLGGVSDDLVGGAGLGCRARSCPPPVEFGDDAAQGGAELVRELSGELLFVAEEGADAVQYRVQRRAQRGQFGRVPGAAEPFLGGYGAPLCGLVGHRPDRAQGAADRQAGQGVGAGEHDRVQGE